jgi:hypothetical protein
MDQSSLNKIKHKKKIKILSGKIILVFLALLIMVTTVIFIHSFSESNKMYNHDLQKEIYNSMLNKDNRLKAYSRAVSLNQGSSANTCVYFLSEVLRMNGEKIDDNICNTTEFLGIMKRDGWKKETDYKKLQPGDICFTTDEKLNSNGTPTHTYIFMAWKDEGKYDYAYVCDNQAKDYDGKIYHLRNISKVETIKGNIKEPFSFFIYKNK